VSAGGRRFAIGGRSGRSVGEQAGGPAGLVRGELTGRAPESPSAKRDRDVIAEQVIRHGLAAVTEHMRVALQGVSGSSAVIESGEFFTGLHLPDGSLAATGFHLTTKAAPAGMLIRHLRERAEIRPGDMFVANDPFIGAIDQADLYLVGPVFDGEELVAWAGAMAHQTDMGGMEFGGLSPRAREVYQESIRLPVVKLVDGGKVRRDVLELILAATRLPVAVGLDLRALIAAIDAARERLGELMRRNGAATVQGVMRRMIRLSEDRLRARLRELPDGMVHAADFLEHDGHQNQLYTVDLLVTKQGDNLRLDFSRSSPQAPGFINATRAGLHAGVAGALLPTLGFGIPWNDGLLRPVETVVPDGLVCTARPPAPVGAASSEAAWVVTNVVAAALNKLLACSPAHLHRAQAVSSGTCSTFALGGVDRHGERFGVQFGDPLAGGGGAWVARNGVAAGGPVCTPLPGIACVERVEQQFPVVYLYRRLARDSGGAGRTRGGHGAEIAVTLSGVASADALVLTHGLEVPNAVGLFGGWPGATVRQRFGHAVLRGHAPVPGVLPGRPEAPESGWEELGPKPGRIPMTGADVFAVRWQGGGGWGDPLERHPDAVWREVSEGVISADKARSMYGVLGDGEQADRKATADLRRGIRTARIGQTVRADDLAGHRPVADRDWPFGSSLRLVRSSGEWRVVTRHGAVLATGTTAWRAGAVQRPIIPDRRSDGILLHHDLAMTGFHCPVSGELLALDIHPVGEPPGDDVLLDLDSVDHLLARTRNAAIPSLLAPPRSAPALALAARAGLPATTPALPRPLFPPVNPPVPAAEEEADGQTDQSAEEGPVTVPGGSGRDRPDHPDHAAGADEEAGQGEVPGEGEAPEPATAAAPGEAADSHEPADPHAAAEDPHDPAR
jgi:N-methylhydantoinase B